MNKEFHFIRPKPAEKAILTNKKLVFQDKYDGISIEAFVDNNSNIELFGRGVLKGKDSNFTEKFPELVNEIKKIDLPPVTNFLAEAIIINPLTGKQDCGMASGRSGRLDAIEYYANNYPAHLVIHDVVRVDEDYVGNKSYLNRLQSIKKHILSSDIISVIECYDDGIAQWQKVITLGLEGLVIRDPVMELGNGGIWKLKQEISEDVYCKGEYTPSTSKTYSNLTYNFNGEMRKGVFTNLTCYQLTKDGREIPVCDVGGGFGVEDRIRIQRLLDSKGITKNNPLVIEIKANDRHEGGKLRSPNFVRIRTDKPWKECIITERKVENRQRTMENY